MHFLIGSYFYGGRKRIWQRSSNNTVDMLQAVLWNARITCGMIKALYKESQLSIIQHSSTSSWSILVLQLPSSYCLFGHFMFCSLSE